MQSADGGSKDSVWPEMAKQNITERKGLHPMNGTWHAAHSRRLEKGHTVVEYQGVKTKELLEPMLNGA